MKAGIQLYSVRESMAKDPVGAIRKVTQAGYRNLEAANPDSNKDSGVGFGISAPDLRALLAETGSAIVSAHISPLEPEKMKPILDYHAAVGTKYIALPIDFYRDRDAALARAESLGKVGALCKQAGIQLVYHNHFHEFQHLGDETILEILLNNTDPDLLKLELDTYWAMRAGKDPVELLKTLGKRVCLLHQKDYTKGFESQMNMLASVEENSEYVDMDRFVRDMDPATFTEIGTGMMDIQGIIDAAAKHCAVEYIIVEQDFSALDEFESIQLNLKQLKGYSGIEW